MHRETATWHLRTVSPARSKDANYALTDKRNARSYYFDEVRVGIQLGRGDVVSLRLLENEVASVYMEEFEEFMLDELKYLEEHEELKDPKDRYTNRRRN